MNYMKLYKLVLEYFKDIKIKIGENEKQLFSWLGNRYQNIYYMISKIESSRKYEFWLNQQSAVYYIFNLCLLFMF